MKILKNVFVSILILFFLTNSSWSKSASEFISSVTIEASNILSSKLTDEEKIVQLKKKIIVALIFTIAKQALHISVTLQNVQKF